ncbi:unnamed protein product, partial [Menidia menidia]
MLQGGFFKVPTQLLELSLTLLVHLNLSGCCSSSFLKSFTDLLKFPGEFLDLLLKLSTKRLFILNLAENISALGPELVDLGLSDVSTFLSLLHLMLHLPEPGHFLELLLATLHGEVLSLIQTMLEVLDCDLQVLLHPLQHHLTLNLDMVSLQLLLGAQKA